MTKNQLHNDAFIKLTNQLDFSDGYSDHALTTITDTVAKTLEVDQVSLWHFSSMTMDAHCMAASVGRGTTQASEGEINLTPHTALLTALQSEFSIPTLNIAKDARTSTMPKNYWMSNNIKSCIHIPIRTIKKIQGFLRLDTKNERDWTADESRFCEHIAELVSQVMLSGEVEKANQRARLLGNISLEITYRYNIPTLLNDLVRRCVETLHATEGEFYLADYEQKMLVGKAGFKASPKFIGSLLPFGENVPGKVAETGLQMLIKDYRTWAGRTAEPGKKEMASSIISTPIKNRGEVTGVLHVTRREGGQPFYDHDREIAGQFANLASLALEKHRLTEQAGHLRKFQDTLAQLIQASNMSNSVMDCMEVSSDYIAHALAVPSTIVRFDNEFSLRGLPLEADKLIESELQKRSRHFDITLVAPDLEALEIRFPELTGFMNRMKLKACILRPIRINHVRSGFVFVATHSPRAWTPEEVGMVEVASQQIGLSIESIRHHQETQSYSDLVKRLTGATSVLNRLLPLDELIPMIGQRALHLSDTDKLALILREQDGVVRSSWNTGISKLEFDKTVQKEGRQILDLLAGDVTPVSFLNINEAPLPPMFKKQLAADRINSLRLTPIVHSGNIIGVVAAFDEVPVEWLPQQREIMMTFANTASLALQSVWYYEQLEKGYLDLALTLANTIDARESDAKTSSMRISDWSQRTAKVLGLSIEEQNLVRWAAMLHNIGKAEVPEEVLQKPGPLSAEERKLVEQYPVRSEKLLSPLNRFREVGKVLRYIHERFDGKGYPDKKKGEDIPMPARILAVADTYGSMIENRPYRQAHSHESALSEIKKNKGTQFDPAVVDAFMQAVSVGPGTVYNN